MPDRHGPLKTGRFEVQIDEVEVPGWQSVTIPGVSVEQGSYREGNASEKKKKDKKGTSNQTWGEPTFDDLEMERGVKPGDTKLYDWFEDVRSGSADSGRKEIAVKLLDEEGVARVGWEFAEAWIKEYDPPDLDASADGEVATESVTVAFDEMIRTDG